MRRGNTVVIKLGARFAATPISDQFGLRTKMQSCKLQYRHLFISDLSIYQNTFYHSYGFCVRATGEKHVRRVDNQHFSYTILDVSIKNKFYIQKIVYVIYARGIYYM